MEVIIDHDHDVLCEVLDLLVGKWFKKKKFLHQNVWCHVGLSEFC